MDKESLASIDENGEFTAKEPGTVVVTATSTDGKDNVAVTDTYTVKITAPVKPDEPSKPTTPSEPTTPVQSDSTGDKTGRSFSKTTGNSIQSICFSDPYYMDKRQCCQSRIP